MDTPSIYNIISKIRPHEIYNLAAQSHVAVSFEQPEYTANADALGTLRILEAIRHLKLIKKTKFYQAGTSELFGGVGKKKLVMKILNFTQEVLMQLRNFMHTGLQ